MRKRINANREIEEQNRIKTGQERLFIKQLARVFDTIDRVAEAEYKKNGSVRRTIASIEGRVEKLLKQHYRRTIITFAGRSEKGETKRQSRFQHITDDYVARQGGEKITQISQTTKNRINKVVARGIADGDGADAIARNIGKATGGAIGRKRAATIAKTEVNAAANFANEAIDRENRGEFVDDRVKRWVSTGDPRTRLHHRAMNGKQVPVDDAFKVRYKGNTYSMQRPGDSAGGAGNVINCRCTLIYIDAETDVIHNGKPSKGTKPIDLSIWPKGASDTEVALTLRSFRDNLPEEMVEMLKNSRVVATIEFNGKRGGVFYPGANKITLQYAPGTTTGKQLLEDIRVYMHERMHALDYLEAQMSVRIEAHSFSNVFNMKKDLDKFYTPAAIEKAAIDAAEEVRKAVGGTFGPQGVPIATADIANDLKGTGLTVKNLLSMLPDARKLELPRRRSVLRLASIHIKHRNWNALDEVFESYNTMDTGWWSMSDYMMAITRGKVGRGHTLPYFNKGPMLNKTRYKRRHATESFAEYGTLRGGINHQAWTRLMHHFAPETTAGFDRLVKVLAKGKRTTAVTPAELGE